MALPHIKHFLQRQSLMVPLPNYLLRGLDNSWFTVGEVSIPRESKLWIK